MTCGLPLPTITRVGVSAAVGASWLLAAAAASTELAAGCCWAAIWAPGDDTPMPFPTSVQLIAATATSDAAPATSFQRNTGSLAASVLCRAFSLDGSPIDQAADAELAKALAYIDDALADGPFLLGEDFSAADIQMSFIPEIAQTLMPIDAYRHIVTWLDRLHGRPAFRRSIERGGDYRLAGKAGLREPVA